ncbi:S9 family peptidase [Altererythrobacter sp. KTW20L]|uniref:alpha/beta hydrolase family protein n=1 Tax=Altererythrobacter sp. KTW20L TaxID=2942210 RepID=UPI0020C0A785|nr:S9 family peptidase [Altererythrobacter sp. KTW20L]MCL6250489.1 S9 family peptidase [Altererythrobacter sp. KTW20L]
MNTTRRALLASALLLSAAIGHNAHARPMTPEDVARIEFTGSVAISRDGSHIAYTTASRPDVTAGEDNGGLTQRLYLADAPMQARAYLPEDVSPGSIGFSPDGSMITYLWADSDDKRAVWGVPVNGGAPRKLAAVPEVNVLAYAMAPSGESTYLLAGPAPDTAREAEAGRGFNARVYEEEQRFNRLFVAASGTAEVDAAPRELEVPGHVDQIMLAPDGTFMVITSAPTTLVDDNLMARRPHILDLASGTVRVVETPGKIGDIEISPDGRHLSLIAGVSINDPAETTLHLVDVATAEITALNAGAAEAATDAEWMADGRLAVTVDVGVQSVLRFYDANGRLEREIDPDGLIFTRLEQGGNRLVALANSPAHPTELFLLTGGEFQRWTAHNPWLAEIDMGVQRAVTFTARDGQEIEGVLIEPVGGVPFERAPLIFDVHGGPEAHESNGWQTGYSKPGQVAAGRGYAVFLPNYRGSTAYGVDFSMQHQGDYAGKEFDDLVDAKYALAEMGIADPDRVGITGGSYGGYASAWGATYYSAEFAASVMSVGISNNISKFGTSDIPNELYLVHDRKWPWEEWDRLLEGSPIFHVDKAETPLLILHGEEDTRVSATQSMELYRHLRIRKPETPVRLVLYPGEGHGNAMAASRYDYTLRMMDWFDTYLMTGNRQAEMPGPRPMVAAVEDEGED